MQDIYDKINDIDFDISEAKLTDIEKKSLYKKADDFSKKSKLKIAAIAAALLVALGLSQGPVRAEVSKAFTDMRVSMMETIGASPESYKYVADLHKPIQISSNEIILENLATEDNKIYYTIIEDAKGKNPEDLRSDPHIYKIKVDGESYDVKAAGGSRSFDEKNKVFIHQFMASLDKDLPAKKDADLDIYLQAAGKNEVIAIKSDINTVNEENKFLGENIDLEDGLELKKMKVNPITMTALFTGLDPDYSYELEGVDENGRKVSLDLITHENQKATFIYNDYTSHLSLDDIRDGRTLKFILSRAKMNTESGRETSEPYQIFKEFEVEAK